MCLVCKRWPPPLQQRLRQHVQVFLAEVPIIGCRGVVVTDAMRLTIAALACLLLLGRHERFHGLREVLLYPSAFVVPQVSATPGGVVHEQRQVLAGQSWSRGQVILAWDAVQHDAAHPASGRNVVLHEFAHQLDQETGAANGAPPMGSRDQAAQWSQVMAQAWQALHARLARGELGVLDPYGATDAAEFFAVATEAFYGRPHELRGEQPELYGVLARWYGVHPAAGSAHPPRAPAPARSGRWKSWAWCATSTWRCTCRCATRTRPADPDRRRPPGDTVQVEGVWSAMPRGVHAHRAASCWCACAVPGRRSVPSWCCAF
jgi:Mlc titration factor MtfA (ptsG expression regulator)